MRQRCFFTPCSEHMAAVHRTNLGINKPAMARPASAAYYLRKVDSRSCFTLEAGLSNAVIVPKQRLVLEETRSCYG